MSEKFRGKNAVSLSTGSESCCLRLNHFKSSGRRSSKNSTSTKEKSASVTMDIFPNHMLLDISVEAENKLGKVESEHLIRESAWFGEFASLFSSQAGI